MDSFIRNIQADSLAAFLLVILIISWVSSVVLILRAKPVLKIRSWFTGFIPFVAVVGLPATIDLLRTGGITTTFSLIVLGVLLLNIIIPVVILKQKSVSNWTANWYSWSIPVLVVGGIVVAGYLTYIEITAGTPVCGITIPGCITVQTSEYARLFGFLPVAVLGLLGYLAILIAWILRQFGAPSIKKTCDLVIWGMCIFGVLFSTYLTYLEVFVIHATCSWCITSAVLMILLLWFSTPAVQVILAERWNEN